MQRKIDKSSARYYQRNKKKGGIVQCKRCELHYEKYGGEILKVGNGYLCIYCKDPEDNL